MHAANGTLFAEQVNVNNYLFIHRVLDHLAGNEFAISFGFIPI